MPCHSDDVFSSSITRRRFSLVEMSDIDEP
jgi:hypothetical protein